MADFKVATQTAPATPAAGSAMLYCDSVSKRWTGKDDAGVVRTLADIGNAATVGTSGYAADTYIAGSNVTIPGSLVRAATCYHLVFDMTKTAAGTATPILNIRFGTAGTTADTARLTFTFAAGTAAVDTGIVEVWAHFRSVGAAGVLTGMAEIRHHLAATGLTATGASGVGIILATSAAFDTTVAASIIGASFDGGAAFSGTNTLVQARLFND